ncbi:hypothetical protein EMCRGX_G033798 [Ephydatia muelleri]|eukprot:Em0022g431a
MDAPRNFSWFVENKLAGMGYPKDDAELAYLARDAGIKTLVNLTEISNYADQAEELGISVHQIAIPDFYPPSIAQIEEFVSIVDKSNGAVGVHCAMGCGRTGTMLACYLVAKEGYSADKAIEETRRRRRNSIETRKQEQAVRTFEESLRK